jgi:hypothetical protein
VGLVGQEWSRRLAPRDSGRGLWSPWGIRTLFGDSGSASLKGAAATALPTGFVLSTPPPSSFWRHGLVEFSDQSSLRRWRKPVYCLGGTNNGGVYGIDRR